jgi:FeS assembly SUF system protein
MKEETPAAERNPDATGMQSAPTSHAPEHTAQDAGGLPELDARVVAALKTCFDPEIPVDIYELGLIYRISVKAHGKVAIEMTLTTPHCPAAQSLPDEIRTKVRGIPGVSDVELDIVWDPPWTPARMSEAAKLELGFF